MILWNPRTGLCDETSDSCCPRRHAARVVRAVVRTSTRPLTCCPWCGLCPLELAVCVQRRNTRDSTRQEARDRLNLEIYAELAKRIEATRQPITRLGTAPSGLLMLLRLPRPPQDDHYRFAQMQAVIDRATDSILALMSILEVYEIALPGFKIFQGELARVRQRADQTFSEFTETVVLHSTAAWSCSGKVAAWQGRLRSSIEPRRGSHQSLDRAPCPLFPAHEISERQPRDPSVKVIRLA